MAPGGTPLLQNVSRLRSSQLVVGLFFRNYLHLWHLSYTMSIVARHAVQFGQSLCVSLVTNAGASRMQFQQPNHRREPRIRTLQANRSQRSRAGKTSWSSAVVSLSAWSAACDTSSLMHSVCLPLVLRGRVAAPEPAAPAGTFPQSVVKICN